MNPRAFFLIVAGLLALLPLAGLYGFGSDAIRDASAAHLSLGNYLVSHDGQVHAFLLAYFMVSEACLVPAIAWSAKNTDSKLPMPWAISKAAALAAYLLLPIGVLPSKLLLQSLRSIGVQA